LIKLDTKALPPPRVVILGANGFVASTTLRRLQSLGIDTLPLSHTDLDLTDENAGTRLAELLQPGDTLLFVAAKAPVKNEQMLLDNIKMGKAVCEAIKKVTVSHVVYISSDAVYADSDQPLNESSSAQPGSLHGVMHLAREVMLANAFQGPLCFLRPTLIYGSGDPHNGYGPNRFKRLAAEGKNIELFGNGEEQRDHVWINDVAEIIVLTIRSKGTGVMNIASGIVVSFHAIAEKAVSLAKTDSKILSNPRIGPMPHNGLRPFDISEAKQSVPAFEYHSLFSVMEKEINDTW